MTCDAIKSTDPPAANTRLLLAVGVLLALAFFVSEHRWDVSLQEHFAVAVADAHLHMEGGSLTRRLAYPSIGLLGLFCIFRKKGCPLSFRGPLATLLTFFFAWCVASLLWTGDPALSMRRLVVLAFCLLGTVGIARQLGPRGLCVLTLGVTTAFVVIGIAAEISLGTFRPFSAGYRFGGTMHPNSQGVCCGVMCLAAACLATHGSRRKFLLIAMLTVAMLLLVLTRSRAAFGALMPALFVLWALGGQRPGKVVASLGVAWIVCIVVLTASLGGLDVGGSAGDVALMGRHDSTGSLNGRTQLWAELSGYFWDQPFLGYGYDGFWDSGHIQDVSSYLGWTINSAHSAYLDTLLAVGLIGAVTLLAAMVVTIAQAVRRYRKFGDVGVAFTVCLLVYGALNGLLESPFFMPTSFVQFVLVSGVIHLAFCRPDDTPHDTPSTESSQGLGLSALRLSITKHESHSG